MCYLSYREGRNLEDLICWHPSRKRLKSKHGAGALCNLWICSFPGLNLLIYKGISIMHTSIYLWKNQQWICNPHILYRLLHHIKTKGKRLSYLHILYSSLWFPHLQWNLPESLGSLDLHSAHGKRGVTAWFSAQSLTTTDVFRQSCLSFILYLNRLVPLKSFCISFCKLACQKPNSLL